MSLLAALGNFELDSGRKQKNKKCPRPVAMLESKKPTTTGNLQEIPGFGRHLEIPVEPHVAGFYD